MLSQMSKSNQSYQVALWYPWYNIPPQTWGEGVPLASTFGAQMKVFNQSARREFCDLKSLCSVFFLDILSLSAEACWPSCVSSYWLCFHIGGKWNPSLTCFVCICVLISGVRKWVQLWVAIRLIEVFLREFRFWWAEVWSVGISWKHAVGAKDFEWFIFCLKKCLYDIIFYAYATKPLCCSLLVSKPYQLKTYGRCCFPDFTVSLPLNCQKVPWCSVPPNSLKLYPMLFTSIRFKAPVSLSPWEFHHE